jgi:hypothetical protein
VASVHRYGLGEGVSQHRLDQRLGEVRQLLVPAADRRAGDVEAVAGIDAFQSVERQRVLPALDDGDGEHPGAGQAALNRALWRLRDLHRRLVDSLLALVLADKLRPHDPHHDQRRGPALEHLADLLADPLVRVQPLALDLGRHYLDLDPRQVLGQRPTGRAPPLMLSHRRALWRRFGQRCCAGRRRRIPGRRWATEEHVEHVEGELRCLALEALRLLAYDDTALEERAPLESLEIELSVMLALGVHLFKVRRRDMAFGCWRSVEHAPS